jgi:hypothetical protein
MPSGTTPPLRDAVQTPPKIDLSHPIPFNFFNTSCLGTVVVSVHTRTRTPTQHTHTQLTHTIRVQTVLQLYSEP